MTVPSRTTTGAIILVRHGRVATAPERLFSREELFRYVEDYDAAPLRADSYPPEELTTRIREVRAIFASELPRAGESARRLGAASDIRRDALFNEEPLRAVPGISVRMPLFAWFAFSRLTETMNPSLRREIAERGEQAALRLIDEAHGGPTALVGHGWFNRAVSRSLIRRGWRRDLRIGGSAPWSFAVFACPD